MFYKKEKLTLFYVYKTDETFDLRFDDIMVESLPVKKICNRFVFPKAEGQLSNRLRYTLHKKDLHQILDVEPFYVIAFDETTDPLYNVFESHRLFRKYFENNRASLS